MARRVKFGFGGAAPLMISVAGADAAGAQFNNVIFNSNQPPLRLFATGYTSVIGISYNQATFGQNTSEGTPTFMFNPPAGQNAMFLVSVVRDGDPTGARDTPFFGRSTAGNWNGTGAGGGMCGPYFVPASFSAALVLPPVGGDPNAPGPWMYVNYCVFKNTN